jgi:hypothetical protein
MRLTAMGSALDCVSEGQRSEYSVKWEAEPAEPRRQCVPRQRCLGTSVSLVAKDVNHVANWIML